MNGALIIELLQCKNRQSLVYTTVSSAHIMVFKMDGVLLNTYPLDATSGELTIEAGEYTPGMYYYSLLVNGEEFDTKRMIITK